MKLTTLKNKAEQLRVAFQHVLSNQLERDVVVRHITHVPTPLHFTAAFVYNSDAVELMIFCKEIEAIMPSMRVISVSCVAGCNRRILFEIKELGNRGAYTIKIYLDNGE